MNDQNQVLQKLPINQLILLARDFIRNDHGAHGDYFCALLAKRWLDDPEVVLKENPHADLRVLELTSNCGRALEPIHIVFSAGTEPIEGIEYRCQIKVPIRVFSTAAAGHLMYQALVRRNAGTQLRMSYGATESKLGTMPKTCDYGGHEMTIWFSSSFEMRDADGISALLAPERLEAVGLAAGLF